MPRTLAPGAIIASRYRLERLLGEGGMGIVWAATHVITGRHVALKFLKAPHDPSDRNRHRLLREARAASSVKHPNVVQVYDVLELEDGAPVIVMELLSGESLQARLDRRRLPLPELCRMLLEVVAAVRAAHAAGVVHRDLKPDNVLLVPGGDRELVKVLDFGVAKLVPTEGDAAWTNGLTRSGALLGTPAYMSPEQAFGENDIDARSDVWALGIIIYQAIAAVVPTAGENFGQIFKTITTGRIKPLAEVAPQTPVDLAELVNRMLVVDRDARVADLGEVADVLARHAEQGIAGERSETAPAGEERASAALASGKHHRSARRLGVVVAGVALAAAAAIGVASRRAPAHVALANDASRMATEVPSPPAASAAAPAEPAARASAAPTVDTTPVPARHERAEDVRGAAEKSTRPASLASQAPRAIPRATSTAAAGVPPSGASTSVTTVRVQREF